MNIYFVHTDQTDRSNVNQLMKMYKFSIHQGVLVHVKILSRDSFDTFSEIVLKYVLKRSQTLLKHQKLSQKYFELYGLFVLILKSSALRKTFFKMRKHLSFFLGRRTTRLFFLIRVCYEACLQSTN